MTTTHPPVSITYDPQADAVYFCLKGSIYPDESARRMTVGEGDQRVVLDFDKAGCLIGIELLSGDMLHPDLAPFAKRLYPAAGEL
jgi:uncharacterized protein YuzE